MTSLTTAPPSDPDLSGGGLVVSCQCQKHTDSCPLLLVADDEPVVRDIVRSMAESIGYRVLLAADASEAIETCERSGTHLDALLLDLRMPGMGPAATARMQRCAPRARVLIITGAAIEEAADCHAHDILLKPFTPAELQHALAHALQGVA